MTILNPRLAHGLASMAFTASHTPAPRYFSTLRLTPALLIINLLSKPVLMHSLTLANKPISVWSNFRHRIALVLRFVQLSAIFLPSAVSLPMCLIPPLRSTWMRVFAWSIEQAGVVWIKLFQYLSHRGDVIGDELADMFVYLR